MHNEWSDALPRLTPEYQVDKGDGLCAEHYSIDAYTELEINWQTRTVRFRKSYAANYASKHGQPFPNLEVRDGTLTIPVDDFTSEVLKRLEPVDLAKALWSDKNVREAFIDEFTENWNSRFTHANRVEALHRLKSAAMMEKINILSQKMMDREWDRAKFYQFESMVRRVNAFLIQNDVRYKAPNGDMELLQYSEPEDVLDFKIGGPNWCEARDYWRKTISELFPTDEKPPILPHDWPEEGLGVAVVNTKGTIDVCLVYEDDGLEQNKALARMHGGDVYAVKVTPLHKIVEWPPGAFEVNTAPIPLHEGNVDDEIPF